MKIALPSRNNKIDDHFGHCEYFTIFTLNDKREIIREETLASPSGCGCKSNIASELAEKGVTLLLAGNMGEGAVNVLKTAGIDVIRGCFGDLKTVLSDWAAGKISDTGINCAAHEHHCEA